MAAGRRQQRGGGGGSGGGGRSMAETFSLAAQRRCSAWQRSCASLRHRDMASPAATNAVAATVRRHGGDEDTGGDSDGGSTNNH